jgi:hypothetical protein
MKTLVTAIFAITTLAAWSDPPAANLRLVQADRPADQPRSREEVEDATTRKKADDAARRARAAGIADRERGDGVVAAEAFAPRTVKRSEERV